MSDYGYQQVISQVIMEVSYLFWILMKLLDFIYGQFIIKELNKGQRYLAGWVRSEGKIHLSKVATRKFATLRIF